MLNRRLLRIKTFKVLFSAWPEGLDAYESVKKTLLLSCDKTVDLYYFLLNICGSLQSLALEKIGAAKNKYNPTKEELNPNLKFVNNKFFKFLSENADFQKYCQRKGLTWGEYDIFVKKMYASIVASDYYAEYMASDDDSIKAEYSFAMRIFEEEFEDNEMLESILEDLSVYWIDDVNYVLNNILYCIDGMIHGKEFVAPKTFIKDEDKFFTLNLLKLSLEHYKEYFDYICEQLQNWDSDRIVSTDATLIVMGLVEAIYFTNIPIKVTINEYVEISKFYSTDNSHTFINGMLDKIIQEKFTSGTIVKSGRGLLDGGQRVSKSK